MDNKFPVMEMQMTKDGLRICLTDDQTSLGASLPKEMVQAIVDQWQAFQNGTASQKVALSRHYTGEWPDLDWQKCL